MGRNYWTVIGPLFLKGILIDLLYLQLFEKAVTPGIVAAIENDAFVDVPIFVNKIWDAISIIVATIRDKLRAALLVSSTC